MIVGFFLLIAGIVILFVLIAWYWEYIVQYIEKHISLPVFFIWLALVLISAGIILMLKG